MDIDKLFRSCLIRWDEKHGGKGSYSDFQDVVLRTDCGDVRPKDLLARFLVLCNGEDHSCQVTKITDPALI